MLHISAFTGICC